METFNFKILNNFRILNDYALIKYLGTDRIVVIPDGIKEVSHFAFHRDACREITEIFIPSSVIELNCPFSHCVNLEKIVVDGCNPSYKIMDNHLYTKDGKMLVSFVPVKNKKCFEIPVGVTAIESFAFSVCDLDELRIPMSITDIYTSALSHGRIKRILLDAGNSFYHIRDGQLLDKKNKRVPFSGEAQYFNCK